MLFSLMGLVLESHWIAPFRAGAQCCLLLRRRIFHLTSLFSSTTNTSLARNHLATAPASKSLCRLPTKSTSYFLLPPDSFLSLSAPQRTTASPRHITITSLYNHRIPHVGISTTITYLLYCHRPAVCTITPSPPRFRDKSHHRLSQHQSEDGSRELEA